jgi:hypothetical protein
MEENEGESADTGSDAGEPALEPGQQDGLLPEASAAAAEAGEHGAASQGEAPGTPGEQHEDTGKDQEEIKVRSHISIVLTGRSSKYSCGSAPFYALS